MDTERENLRQLFLDFIDTQPDDEWDDTDAWKRYLQAYDDLLAEVEQLQKELEESKENFRLFRDSVVRPVLKHVYSKEERESAQVGDVVTVLIESDDGNYSRTFIFRDLTVADDFRKRVIPIMQKRGYAVYHAILNQSNDSVESALEDSIIRDYLEEE